GDADGDPFGPGIDRTTRHQRVLGLQDLHQRIRIKAERGDLLGGEFEIDAIILHADQFDLGDVVHAQQFSAHLVGNVVQFAVAETVRGQREYQRIGIAEFVVEERAGYAGGQGGADIVNLLADLVPQRLHRLAAHHVLQVDE